MPPPPLLLLLLLLLPSVAILILLLYLRRRRSPTLPSSPPPPNSLLLLSSLPLLPLRSLSPSVFLSSLPDGTSLAVKHLPHSLFLRELRLSSHLPPSPFIIPLLGYCPRRSLLIYPFMPNQTLHHALFSSPPLPPFPWPLRFRILLDIAHALSFLHLHSLIHADLKPSNILLDSLFRAKLADFGLSRHSDAHCYGNNNNNNNNKKPGEFHAQDLCAQEHSGTAATARGTVCYVAPECGGCGPTFEKADIYSFGVLVLVVVSGRRPLHVQDSPMRLERANLVSWCRQLALKGDDVMDVLDERLRDSCDGDLDQDQVRLCINLALLCLQRTPELRPQSGDIVKILEGEMEIPLEPAISPPIGGSMRREKQDESG